MPKHIIYTLFLLLVFLSGCATGKQDEKILQDINAITILPFISVENDQALLPDEEENGLHALTSLLHEKFEKNSNVNFISTHEAITLAWELPDKPEIWTKKIGSNRKTDAVLAVSLFRYQERVGENYAAQTPASVGFDFRLISTMTGEILCFGRFDKTQKPLTENMLDLRKSFDRGFKWLTAEQLLREGVMEVFSDCPYLAH